MKIRIGPYECETDATNSFDPSRIFPPGSAILGLPQAPLERMSHKYFTKLLSTQTKTENYEENFATFMTDSANLLNAERKRMRSDKNQNDKIEDDISISQKDDLFPLIEGSFYNQPPTLRMVHCSTTRCIRLIDAEKLNNNNINPPPLQFVVFSNNASPSITQRPKMIRETTGTGMAVGGRTQKKSLHTYLFPPPSEMIQVANQSRKNIVVDKNNQQQHQHGTNNNAVEEKDDHENCNYENVSATFTAETRQKQHKLQAKALLPLLESVELAGQCALQQIPVGCQLFSPLLASRSQQHFQRTMRKNEFEDDLTIAEEFSALMEDDEEMMSSRFSSSKREEVEKLFSRNFSMINSNNKKSAIVLATFLDVDNPSNEADTTQRIDKLVTLVEKTLWRDENGNNNLVTVERNLSEIEDQVSNHILSSVRISMKHLIPVFRILSIRIADHVANPPNKQPTAVPSLLSARVPRITGTKQKTAAPKKPRKVNKQQQQQQKLAVAPPEIKCHKRLILIGFKWSTTVDLEEAKTIQALTGSNSAASFSVSNKDEKSLHVEDQTHDEVVQGLFYEIIRKTDYDDDDEGDVPKNNQTSGATKLPQHGANPFENLQKMMAQEGENDDDDDDDDDEINLFSKYKKVEKESGKRREREE